MRIDRNKPKEMERQRGIGIIVGFNIGLSLLTILSSLLFYSLISDNGYQLYCAFILIPLLTIAQFFKIYFMYKYDSPKILFNISLIMVATFYIPLSDALLHDIKITYPLSTVTYFILSVFYILETMYIVRKRKLKEND